MSVHIWCKFFSISFIFFSFEARLSMVRVRYKIWIKREWRRYRPKAENLEPNSWRRVELRARLLAAKIHTLKRNSAVVSLVPRKMSVACALFLK